MKKNDDTAPESLPFEENRGAGWRRLWRRFGPAVLLLLVFGLVRIPMETALTREHRAASFGRVQLDLSLRERLGQMGFLAALSGFRTLVADLLWIQAHSAWERVEYGRMKFIFDTVTILAPRNVGFWDMSSWHMAYNASVAAMEDRKQPKEILRKKAQREYFLLGKDYAERGIANNPDAYVLYQSLGNIYKYKLEDHCAASAAFEKAAACPNAPSYEKRFAAYELSYCPGHEQEAWRRLRYLYDLGPQERLPTLESRLKAMEEKLALPPEQRVYKTP
jgi:hypothetical protein